MGLSENSTTTCPLERKKIENAIEALLKVLKRKEKEKLIDEHPRINLLITTHTISKRKGQTVLIQLPHPIFSNSSEICVFTKDLDKKDIEKSQEHFEETLTKALGFAPKVISVTSLKKDYKSYEAKRQLSDSYDLFLADKRTVKSLPALLGNHFYKKKKQPISVNVTASDLKSEFNKKISSTRWLITGNGNCSMMQVAFANFSKKHIADNVEACVAGIAGSVMRGWDNVKSLYIKSDDSLAVPLYINDVISDALEEKDGREIDFVRRVAKRKNKDDIYSIPTKKIKESLAKSKILEGQKKKRSAKNR